MVILALLLINTTGLKHVERNKFVQFESMGKDIKLEYAIMYVLANYMAGPCCLIEINIIDQNE